jgi:hypothetical protein
VAGERVRSQKTHDWSYQLKKYRIFDTEAEAIAAEAAISASLGLPKPGVNAATGEIQPGVMTQRWDEPRQIPDGRWVFLSPDEEGVEPDWDTGEGEYS